MGVLNSLMPLFCSAQPHRPIATHRAHVGNPTTRHDQRLRRMSPRRGERRLSNGAARVRARPVCRVAARRRSFGQQVHRRRANPIASPDTTAYSSSGVVRSGNRSASGLNEARSPAARSWPHGQRRSRVAWVRTVPNAVRQVRGRWPLTSRAVPQPGQWRACVSWPATWSATIVASISVKIALASASVSPSVSGARASGHRGVHAAEARP